MQEPIRNPQKGKIMEPMGIRKRVEGSGVSGFCAFEALQFLLETARDRAGRVWLQGLRLSGFKVSGLR